MASQLSMSKNSAVVGNQTDASSSDAHVDNEDHSEETPQNIQSLLNAKDWLDEHLQQYKLSYITGQSNASVPECDNLEELSSRISKLQDEFISESSNNDIKQLIIKRLQLCQEAIKSLFPPKTAGSGDAISDADLDARNTITELVNRQTQLVTEIILTQHEMDQLHPATNALRKENLELKKANREIMTALKDHQESEDVVSRSQQDDKVKKSRTRLEHLTSKLEIITHVCQGIIFGSNVNWMEDEELTELLLQLAEPIPNVK